MITAFGTKARITEVFVNPALWLHRSALTGPNRPALFKGDEPEADYRCFDNRAASLGRSLVEAFGLEAGDRVALFAKNATEYLEALFGIWYAGGIAVPVNAKLHPKEAAWILGNAGAKICFGDAKSIEQLSETETAAKIKFVDLSSAQFDGMRNEDRLSDPVSKSDRDIAWLFYTSGTTGRPKGVMISCGNLQAMALNYLSAVDDVCDSDTAFYAAPISHGAGLYCLQHVLKGTGHAVPVSKGFDPAEIFAAAEKLRNLHMFAAPTMIKRLVDHARAVGKTGDGIKTIVYGGGPMYLADIIEAVEVLGPRFCQIYGQGESPMTITVLSKEFVNDREHPRWRQRLQSAGVPHPQIDVKTVDNLGNDVPAGEPGEIIVKGPTVMSGYWQNPEATAQTIKNGWLFTGDVGAVDQDGFLTLMDRSKDVIISGGTNIYPREVEEVLLNHPDVVETSVIGKPDAEWGESVVAFIVARAGTKISAAELDSHCRNEIAGFKRPKGYRFVDELPKNNYGKVLKTKLRKLVETECKTQND